jgi:hypothetical protein
MAKKTSKKTVNQILKETMPGMEVIKTPPPATPDAVKRTLRPGPSMGELRRKYLGAEADEDQARGVADLQEEEDDVEVKRVRRKQSPADPADDPGPRTVIVSKRKGIIGDQG